MRTCLGTGSGAWKAREDEGAEGVAPAVRALAAVGRQPLALEVERACVLVEEAEGRLEMPEGRLEQLLHHPSPRARVEGVGEVVLEHRKRIWGL